MSVWRNAFKINQGQELTEEEKDFIIKVVSKIKKVNLTTVALLTIESTRPFHTIGANFLYFIKPTIGFMFSDDEITKIAKILENPKGIDFFKSKLEEVDNGG